MDRRSSSDASFVMSSSTRSKPASQSSPVTGPEADVQETRSSGGGLEVELEVARERLWGWAIGGVILGLLLVWKLGTVGVWAGYVLIALGLYRAYLLVQTFRHPPGTIAVGADKIKLPRGLHRGAPVEAAPGEVTACYLLRK